jgi:hypothetical protein
VSLIKSDARPLGSRLKSALRTKYGGGTGLSDKSALMLDNSGSMAGDPLTQLNELADNFTDCRRFKFSTTCQELAHAERIPEVEGGTNMANAFLEARGRGIEHLVLLTDGQPDSESAALRAAHGLRIDVFYIGPDPAPDFLKLLARETGGSYGKASLDRVAELTASVREKLRIEAPKGAIRL